MLIENAPEDYRLDFGVCVQCHHSLKGGEVESITLMSKDKHIRLSKAECEELMNVLYRKKCFQIEIFSKDDDYSPHTTIGNSSITKDTLYLKVVMSREEFLKEKKEVELSL